MLYNDTAWAFSRLYMYCAAVLPVFLWNCDSFFFTATVLKTKMLTIILIIKCMQVHTMLVYHLLNVILDVCTIIKFHVIWIILRYTIIMRLLCKRIAILLLVTINVIWITIIVLFCSETCRKCIAFMVQSCFSSSMFNRNYHKLLAKFLSSFCCLETAREVADISTFQGEKCKQNKNVIFWVFVMFIGHVHGHSSCRICLRSFLKAY